RIKNQLACLAIVPIFGCSIVWGDENANHGFVEDSHLTLLSRNFYFNRNFLNGGSNSLGRNSFKPQSDRNGYAEEWAQGFMADFRSGWTPGTFGFGVDAYSYLGVKLDSGGGRTGLRLMPITDDGHPQDSFSKNGASVKAKLSKTMLYYGNLFPAVPVFSVNTVRLFPSSATGWMLQSDDIGSTHLDAGYFTSRGRGRLQ
ncbi:OprD family outer membrane porin, partial [Pseudomonas helleri]